MRDLVLSIVVLYVLLLVVRKSEADQNTPLFFGRGHEINSKLAKARS
jgi:hypothetical protein